MLGTVLDIGAVVAVYQQGTSVDVLLNDGGRLSNVQVMVSAGSDATGQIDLTDVGGPQDETRWNLTKPFERNVRAIIGYFHHVPLCLGFLLPQVSQMTFQRKNFRIDRHASDVYKTINDSGDMEVYHPSGTYFRIGASPAHEDLTGKDYDKRWKIARNTGAAPHVHLQVANAGSAVATIDIDPAGNLSIQHNGNMMVSVGGNLQATVVGTTTVDSSGNADLKAPQVTVDSPQTTFTGAVTVQGPLAFQAGASGTAGSGGGPAMTITGDAHYTGTVSADTDVLAAGKSGKGHKHGNVLNGGDVSAGPQ